MSKAKPVVPTGIAVAVPVGAVHQEIHKAQPVAQTGVAVRKARIAGLYLVVLPFIAVRKTSMDVGMVVVQMNIIVGVAVLNAAHMELSVMILVAFLHIQIDRSC